MDRDTQLALTGVLLGVIIGVETFIVLGQKHQINTHRKSRKEMMADLKRHQMAIDVLLPAIPSEMRRTILTRLEFGEMMVNLKI